MFIVSATDTLFPLNLHDLLLQFSFLISVNHRTTTQIVTKKLFFAADYPTMNIFMCSIDWDRLLSELSVDESVDVLYTHLNNCITHFVPIIEIRKSEYPPRFSKELITNIKMKKLAHIQYKRSNHLSDYLSFFTLRSECKKFSMNYWNKYDNQTEANLN